MCGCASQKAGNNGSRPWIPKATEGIHAHRAARAGRALGQVTLDAIELLQQRTAAVEIDLPLGGGRTGGASSARAAARRGASRSADELADRRRRHMQLPRGRGETGRPPPPAGTTCISPARLSIAQSACELTSQIMCHPAGLSNGPAQAISGAMKNQSTWPLLALAIAPLAHRHHGIHAHGAAAGHRRGRGCLHPLRRHADQRLRHRRDGRRTGNDAGFRPFRQTHRADAAHGIFTLGNLLSALAPGYTTLLLARLDTSLNHGAFFGLGAVVAASVVPPEKRASAVATMFIGPDHRQRRRGAGRDLDRPADRLAHGLRRHGGCSASSPSSPCGWRCPGVNPARGRTCAASSPC